MELKQLEYFLAVAKAGAFSRAAMLLSVGQPVLSRQIKALEEELGAELYHRTGRGIVLTDAGQVLADTLAASSSGPHGRRARSRTWAQRRRGAP